MAYSGDSLVVETPTRVAVGTALRSSAGTMTVCPHILALNAGSSTLKFSLFSLDASTTCVLSGVVDRIGSAQSTLSVTGSASHEGTSLAVAAPDHVAALHEVLRRVSATNTKLDAVGHRVVHGGERYRAAQRVDRPMCEELRRIIDLDREHLPSALAMIEAITVAFPDTPQVACFDTEFHRELPRVARILPIPRRYEAMGVHRYGFHGLSYAYLMQELTTINALEASGRVILAHLGNGASMSAVYRQQCVDTTMALTPASGLVMSTRSGDIDPGLAAFLSRREGVDAERFEQIVNHESGLLGVSETSADMRDLLEHEHVDVRAAEAVALFCYQARKCLGAYAAALGGVDSIVFAGGIGEYSPIVRSRICDGLEFLGVVIDPKRNAENASVISANSSRVAVRVMHTNEQLMIARSTGRVLGIDPYSPGVGE